MRTKLDIYVFIKGGALYFWIVMVYTVFSNLYFNFILYIYVTLKIFRDLHILLSSIT